MSVLPFLVYASTAKDTAQAAIREAFEHHLTLARLVYGSDNATPAGKEDDETLAVIHAFIFTFDMFMVRSSLSSRSLSIANIPVFHPPSQTTDAQSMAERMTVDLEPSDTSLPDQDQGGGQGPTKQTKKGKGKAAQKGTEAGQGPTAGSSKAGQGGAVHQAS